MENIYLTKREIDYRKKHPINDDFKGAYGSCTYYNGGILKVFHVHIDDDIYLTDTDPFYDKDNQQAKKWLKDCSYKDVFHSNIHEMNYVFNGVLNDIGNQIIWIHHDELRDVNYIYKYFDEIKKVTNNSVKTLREYCLYRK